MHRTGTAPIIIVLAASLWLPGLGLSQGADSLGAALPDPTMTPEGADSLDAALPDSAGNPEDVDSLILAPQRLAGPSPFSGKSVERERGDFLALTTSTSGEAFAFEPGIGLLEYGSPGLPQDLRVRTGRPGDVMYLMDGVPVSDPQLEIFDLVWLPLAGMARAEVAMNGQSGLYGSGATGGAVNLTSMSAMPEVPVSEVVAWWGSFDSRAVNFRINRRITSSFGILAAFENLHSGGWTESSGANSNKFYGKLSGLISRGVTYDLVGYRYDAGIELPDLCPDLEGTYPKRDFIRASVAGGSDVSVRLDYYHLGTERDFESGGEAHTGKGRLDGFSVITSRVTQDSLDVAVGAGLRRREVSGDTVGDESTTDIYGYAAGEMPLRAWRLRGSLRVERNSRHGTELAGDLGATAKILPWCLFFGRIDRSFAFPSLLECRRAVECCSEDVDTEHWNGLELGTDLGTEPVRFSAAVYWRHVDNRTFWVRDEACEWAPVVDEGISILGAEALLHFAYSSWLKGSVGYCADRARDRAGRKVSYTPSGVLTWDLRAQRVFTVHVSAGLTLAGRRVPAVDVGNQLAPCSEIECVNEAELDGYVSGLLYGYLEIDRARVYARVRNLFNQGITQRWGRLELPPRTYEIGVNWELLD